MTQKIYVAGQMSGIENNNHNSFFKKEKELTEAGWDVVNPARLDIEEGFNYVDTYSYEAAASRDIKALKDCNAIYMMAGWEKSKGACWERALAKFWDKLRFYEIPRADHEYRRECKTPSNNTQ